MLIQSRVIPNAYWNIKREIFWLDDKQKSSRALKTTLEIMKQENDFIANYDPVIYFNDLSCEHWCFDAKLPSGGWLENISVAWKDGKQIFNALILC